MKLTAAHTFAASREKVFAALTDPAVLQKCVEGCEELVAAGADAWDARLKVGIAMLKGSYAGRLRIKDRKPPESFTLEVEGKGATGFVRGSARIRLEERDGRTDLACDADVAVGGLIAAVGSRLIEAAAKKMQSDFFSKLATHVSAGG